MIYHNTLTYCNEETKSIWFGVATGLSCLTIGTIEMMIIKVILMLLIVMMITYDCKSLKLKTSTFGLHFLQTLIIMIAKSREFSWIYLNLLECAVFEKCVTDR